MNHKLIAAIIIIIASLSTCYCQELFNNGGFENYYNCPTGFDESIKIKGLAGKEGTPEYYNCSFYPTKAHTGTGSVRMGAIRNYFSTTKTNTYEGVTLQLDGVLQAGVTYTISLYVNYMMEIYGDAAFDYAMKRNCYTLKFAFSSSVMNGNPSTYAYQIDGDADVGNANNSYHYYSFNYTPTSNVDKIYIVNAPAAKTSQVPPAAECCTCNSSKAYVYNYIIDDLSIVPQTTLSLDLQNVELLTKGTSTYIAWSVLADEWIKYRIYGSMDGKTYDIIDSLLGDKSEAIEIPLHGKDKEYSYYKLEAMNSNGTIKSVKVLANESINSTRVYFDNGSIVIRSSGLLGIQQVSVVDLLGNELIRLENESVKELKIPCATWNDGLYLIKVIGDNEFVSKINVYW